MKFKYTYTQRSLKDIAKLDRVVKKQIAKKLPEFLLDPIKHSKPLKEHRFGKRRFRIGSYGIVFDMEGSEIVILRIDHRGEIYK